MTCGRQPPGGPVIGDGSIGRHSAGWKRSPLQQSAGLVWFPLCLLLLLHIGCSGRVTDTRGHGDAVLKEVTRAYVAHLRTNSNHPPADEAEFRRILAQAGDAALKRAGVGSIDDLLVSPRDSLPFVIAYGTEARIPLERGVVAYEQTGVSGRRLVGYALGYVDDVDQQAFDEIMIKP